MLLTIDQYAKEFGNEAAYPRRLSKGNKGVIICGMLKWNDKDAGSLAGPFKGGFAFITISDEVKNRKSSPDKVMSYEDTLKKNLKAAEEFKKEFKFNNENAEDLANEWTRETPTLEKPFEFYICGNDDSSWTKFFESQGEALDMLDIFEQQPPTFKDILFYGFFFSN
jgi:hypothetical protein